MTLETYTDPTSGREYNVVAYRRPRPDDSHTVGPTTGMVQAVEGTDVGAIYGPRLIVEPIAKPSPFDGPGRVYTDTDGDTLRVKCDPVRRALFAHAASGSFYLSEIWDHLAADVEAHTEARDP